MIFVLHGWRGEYTWWEIFFAGSRGGGGGGLFTNLPDLDWSQLYFDPKTKTVKLRQSPTPDFNRSLNCQSEYLNGRYGPAPSKLIPAFSAFNFLPSSANFGETVRTTAEIGLLKGGAVTAAYFLGNASVKATIVAGAEALSATTGILTGYATLTDAEAKFLCRDVSAANSF